MQSVVFASRAANLMTQVAPTLALVWLVCGCSTMASVRTQGPDAARARTTSQAQPPKNIPTNTAREKDEDKAGNGEVVLPQGGETPADPGDSQQADRQDGERAMRTKRLDAEREAAGIWTAKCPQQVSTAATEQRCGALVKLRDGCKAGVAHKCTELAICFATGASVTADRARAMTLFRHACKRGDGLGCRFSGQLKRACQLRDRDACVAIAIAALKQPTASSQLPNRALLANSCQREKSALACRFLGLRAWQASAGKWTGAEASLRWLRSGCRQCDRQSCVAASGILRMTAEQGHLQTTALEKARAESAEMAQRACALGHQPACESEQP